jgi:outer membrane protein insertion porin family
LLRLSGRLSKIGTGEPLDWGLADQFLCGHLADDPIGSSKLNYSASVGFTQPAFLSPDNTFGLSFFAERRSEFAVYLREEIGGNLSVTREGPSRIPVTLAYRLAWGSTEASDANFCAYFNACNPADIAVLTARQRQGVVTIGISRLRVNSVLDPTRGNSLAAQVSQSGAFTGSEELQRFTRLSGDFTVYRPLTGSVVAAVRIRAGVEFAPTVTSEGEEFTYIPPDQRFYAGGSNDVRGYDRNDLGPIVYVVLDSTKVPAEGDVNPDDVTVSPIGGNRLFITNVELRVPAPFFPARWRLVGFVDGGAVWEDSPTLPSPFRFRVTPGVGLRIGTPLGPARLDVAYNGYGYPPGPLYVTRSDGSLEAIATDYVKPKNPGFTIHIAIGQAF